MLLDFRKPPLVLFDKFVSSSGVFLCFYGIHYVKGHACYDVGTSNKRTGEIVRRHYNSENNIAPEASAKTYWETLKEQVHLLRKREQPDDPTFLEATEQWLDIHMPGWRKRKPS